MTMIDRTVRYRQELIESLEELGIKATEEDLGGGDVGVIVQGKGGHWSFVCGNSGVLYTAWAGEFHRTDGQAECSHEFNSVNDVPRIVAWAIWEKFILRAHTKGDGL